MTAAIFKGDRARLSAATATDPDGMVEEVARGRVRLAFDDGAHSWYPTKDVTVTSDHGAVAAGLTPVQRRALVALVAEPEGAATVGRGSQFACSRTTARALAERGLFETDEEPDVSAFTVRVTAKGRAVAALVASKAGAP